MIFLVKIISVFLAALVITKTYHDFKKQRENLTMLLFWTGAWLAIVIVALFPEIIQALLSQSGGRAGVGTFFGIALIFVFYVTYRVYQKAHRIEQQLRDMVTKLGLNDTLKHK